ncbi:MAG TPA: hypothetical protein VMB50_01295, partial [Myxococcales bacterium]|nr:hypothetical protein [Myxococcales bacterium]
REAEDPKAFAEAVDALLEKYELPDDPYLLDRILDHPKAQVVQRVLDHLLALAEAGKLQKPPKSLGQRLQSLELTSDDPDVQEKAQALAKKLR